MPPQQQDNFDSLVFLHRISKDPSMLAFLAELNRVRIENPIDLDVILDELKTFKVDLPRSYTMGVGKVNELNSTIQGFRDRVTEIALDVSRALFYRTRLRDLASEHLLTTYDEVRNLRSVELRTAAVASGCQEFIREVARGEFVEQQIKKALDNLIAKNDNLSRQVTVVDLQLKLGEINRKGG